MLCRIVSYRVVNRVVLCRIVSYRIVSYRVRGRLVTCSFHCVKVHFHTVYVFTVNFTETKIVNEVVDVNKIEFFTVGNVREMF